MYGTVAKLRVKAGKAEEFKDYMDIENRDIPGILDLYIYQTDEDESVLYMAVIFQNKDAYVKYSESPDSNDRYLKMMELLEGEPEWHDGHVIFHRKF